MLRPKLPTCTPFAAKAIKEIGDWHQTGPVDHFVQFYHTDDYLIECLAGYMADGLWRGEVAIVIATAEHRVALDDRLRVKGVNLNSSLMDRRYLAYDAEEMLAKFMIDGRPDQAAFRQVIGELLDRILTTGRRVRAFGEMVGLLWQKGHQSAAIALEELWNQLGREHAFRLYCAYPSNCVDGETNAAGFSHICAAHSAVMSLSP